MHGVSTASQHTAINRILNVFHTNGAVLLEPRVVTLVIILHTFVVAAVAPITVERVFLPSHSTDATLITVEHAFLLRIVIIKSTHFAVVFGEVYFAFDASSRFGLLVATAETLNVGYFVAVECVVDFGVCASLPFFVVTESAHVILLFACGVRTLFLTASVVVFAA